MNTQTMQHEGCCTTMEKRAETNVTRSEHTRSGRYYRPNLDILERRDELTVVADMPGVHGKDIEIDFEKGVLTLYGRVQPRQKPETDYVSNEYGIGDFYRTFQVSEAVDASRIHADYADGVLTLHLPKTEAAKPRKILVKTS